MSASPKGEYLEPCGVWGGYPAPGDEGYLEPSPPPCCLYMVWSNPAGLDRECPWELTMLARWLLCGVVCGKVGRTDGAVLTETAGGRFWPPGVKAPGRVTLLFPLGLPYCRDWVLEWTLIEGTWVAPASGVVG
jgi:hypothetical protein